MNKFKHYFPYLLILAISYSISNEIWNYHTMLWEDNPILKRTAFFKTFWLNINFFLFFISFIGIHLFFARLKKSLANLLLIFFLIGVTYIVLAMMLTTSCPESEKLFFVSTLIFGTIYLVALFIFGSKFISQVLIKRYKS